jgi:hypothetical protein
VYKKPNGCSATGTSAPDPDHQQQQQQQQDLKTSAQNEQRMVFI